VRSLVRSGGTWSTRAAHHGTNDGILKSLHVEAAHDGLVREEARVVCKDPERGEVLSSVKEPGGRRLAPALGDAAGPVPCAVIAPRLVHADELTACVV